MQSLNRAANHCESLIQLSWRSAMYFSKYSSRQTTPKILRDHRFTRKGMVLGPKTLQYTFNPELVPASQQYQHELFKDKKTELISLRKAADEVEKNLKNQHIFTDHKSTQDTILLEIADQFLINNHPQHVLNQLLSLNSQPDNKPEVVELIENALRILISKQIRAFGLRDFGVAVTLSRRYVPNDSKLWNQLANNFCRLIQRNEYHDRKILDKSRSQKQLDNIVLTLTSVLKFAHQHQLDTALESLSDAASSYLTSNIEVVQDINNRFLLLSGVIPLLAPFKALPLLKQITSQANTFNELNASTLTSIVNSVNKTRQNAAKLPKAAGPVSAVIDAQFLQKIEQAFFKQFDGKNDSILAVFSLSLAQLGYQGETKTQVGKYIETQTISSLKNLAFFGEALKKFHSLSPKYFTVAEIALKTALAEKNPSLTPALALQFLRVSSKKLTFSAEIVNQLISIVDNAYYFKLFTPKPTHTEMIVKTLQKYAQVTDLANLRIYQALIGSKKIL